MTRASQRQSPSRRHRRLHRATGALVCAAAALALSRCASAPPAPAPAPKAPAVPFEQKMAWILRLEDQRLMKLETPAPPPLPPPPPAKGRKPVTAPVVVAPPAVVPDLARLVHDDEPRVRRRAALAIGRVGLPEGIKPLVETLADPDADVRSMAAFAAGLVAVSVLDLPPALSKVQTEAGPPLIAALADPSPLVRGRAAEALGQLGAKEAAEPIGQMTAEYARTPAVAAMRPDDEPSGPAGEVQAFRLGLFALVRLRAYEPLAAAILDSGGRPTITWWPAAYALQRIGDPRARPALLQLLSTPGKYTAAFAARGLGAIKDPGSVDALAALIARGQLPIEPLVAAIRALGQIGDGSGAAPLVRLLSTPETVPNVRLECVAALGAMHAAAGLPFVQDLVTDPWPAMRAAALRSAAAIDQENFVLVSSSLDRDPQWTVRAALAEVFSTLPAEVAAPRLQAMLDDDDKRVLPAVMTGLVRAKAPEAAEALLSRLKDADFALRASAARLLGELKAPGGAEALREAFKAAQSDSAPDARAAILSALVAYGAAEATDTLKSALADKDWSVRRHAVGLLTGLDPAGNYLETIRPAPGAPTLAYNSPDLIAPPFSPHVFIETVRGTIEFELTVLDAPQTTRNFVALARRGFFNGLPIHRVVPNFVVQDGDPRGDGEGGPGYTIRDELNDRAFVRGSVGMALSGRDTGGSQFFITHSPQPHLDARYTVFGFVVNGMEFVDRIQQGDVIQRVRVWDGKAMQ